jgi:hypothetical protein
LILHVAVAGTLALQFALPNSTGLVGASFRQQVVPLELDASSAIAAVTATNTLQLTIGQF